MSDAEVERAIARIMLPRLVVITIICAIVWTAGVWLDRLPLNPGSVAQVAVAWLAWSLRVAGRGGTIGLGILILLLALHWAVNALIPSRHGSQSPVADVVILSYSWPWKIISLTSFAFAIFCVVVFSGSPNDRDVRVILTASFLVGGAASLVAFNLSRIRVWSYGIDVERPFRARQIPWSSIHGAHVKNEYLVLVTAASPPLRISTYMRNTDRLFDELERRNIAIKSTA